jgi:hypothetical protein
MRVHNVMDFKMRNALTVNEVIDHANDLDGQPVAVVGLLTFEFERHCLDDFSKAERRAITEAVAPRIINPVSRSHLVREAFGQMPWH